MERGALVSPEFTNWARGIVCLAHITTRIPGRPDDDLLTRLGGLGYPDFMFLDAQGELLAGTDPLRVVMSPPAAAVAYLDSRAQLARRFRHLRAVTHRTRAQRLEWLITRARLERVSLADACKEASAWHLAPVDDARLRAALTDLEVREYWAATRQPGRTSTPERDGRLLAMLRQGRRPTDEWCRWTLYRNALGAAERAGDAKAYATALIEVERLTQECPWIRRLFAEAPKPESRAAAFLARCRLTLERLQAAATTSRR